MRVLRQGMTEDDVKAWETFLRGQDAYAGDLAWAPRFIRGSRTEISNHAYGAAIDLNVPWNRLGVVPALKGKQGCVRELVPIANEFGIYWGGYFVGRPDGMHFELARV